MSVCLILVGGYGTRLRPLTFSTPKPLVPFCNLPIVEHQIAAAASVGVKHIILAIGFNADALTAKLSYFEEKYHVKVYCSVEASPLGTAGPLRLAESIINHTEGDEIFVFNSDVICQFPLSQLLNFHRESKGEGTICTTPVEDYSRYGVVCYNSSNRLVESFVEKPSTYVGSNEINAGLYILNKSIIQSYIPPETFTMFETSVFPKMVENKKLFCFKIDGYWADIGKPDDFINGTIYHLNSIGEIKNKTSLPPSTKIIHPVLIDDNVKIGENCTIGPNVTIGKDTIIGDGVCIENSVVFSKCYIANNSIIFNHSLIGWGCRIGKWNRINNVVFGEDVVVSDKISVYKVTVCPFKSVKESVEKQIIL